MYEESSPAQTRSEVFVKSAGEARTLEHVETRLLQLRSRLLEVHGCYAVVDEQLSGGKKNQTDGQIPVATASGLIPSVHLILDDCSNQLTAIEKLGTSIRVALGDKKGR